MAGAVALFRQALDLDASLDLDPEAEAKRQAAEGKVEQAPSLAQRGKIEEAIAAIEEARTLDPTVEIPASTWNTLCRRGSLAGYAADVLDACEQAVALAPEDGGIRESRGLARALTGDVAGAIEDFQFYVDRLGDEETRRQRQDWIRALQAGRNPFDAATLEAL